MTLRAGKFKLAFGKHNQLHSHAFPFVDEPLVNQAIFGDEGLNEVGASAAILFPVNWYSELTVQVFSPGNDVLYDSPHSGDLGGLVRLKNLWDWSESMTLELGASATTAKNALDQTSSAWGADLTIKWRPTEGGKSRALIWSTEYISAKRGGFTDSVSGESTERLGGIASSLQYQFAERWWIQGRAEFLGVPHSEAIAFQNKKSALLGFFPSEFSGLRLQYDHLVTQGKDKADHAIAFQYNISIGAHPAHAY